MKEVYLTQDGFDALKDRLVFLKTDGRKQVTEDIKIAREFGDLSENAEYDAAKDKQGRIEQEIKEIEEKLQNVVIIDESANKKVVGLGSTVKVLDIEFDDEIEYRIVGTTEADVAKNLISNESPLGSALMGHKKNDIVTVNTPNGDMVEYKILSL